MKGEGKRKMNGKGKDVIRKTIKMILIAALLAATGFSGIKLYQMLIEYGANRDAYRKISESVSGDDDFLNVDFYELKKTNPDIVGWIRYKGTPIDYPIVKGKDNRQYLYTRFDGSYSDFGTLFVDSATEYPFHQFNTVVYGHHMQDGSMFGSLKKLKDPEYCRKHPKMELATPGGNYDLQIYAFLNKSSDSKVFTHNVGSEEDRSEYLKWINDNAVYTTDVDLNIDDRLVILSTCAYEYNGARYIVVCKMIPG